MFAVLIEAEPRKEQRDSYFAKAAMLDSGLARAPGFVESARYRSLTRDGWILSLSDWTDGASLARWHERMREEEEQWRQLVADFRLRFGEVTSDTKAGPAGEVPAPPGDEAGGEGTYVTLIDARQAPEWIAATNPYEMALYLGFDLYSYGDCISWDIFDSLTAPGAIVLAVTWGDARSANDHASTQIVPDDARVRVVRIVRDDMMAELAGSAGAAAPGREPVRG
ncbi:MAG TPA: antibiotic biosynthesis monooxygenase [Thermoanaerobaculia bacterium]|nr:antibiotic biosynthesis monooxygenase [Thermoanaerobaculia bacterium]